MTRTAAPAVWVLEFDEYPSSPNARLHHFARAREAKRWKEAAYVLAQREHIPAQQRVRLSAVIVRRVIGRSDEDNDRARLKNVVDGIVSAGVIPDDNRAHVEWGQVTEERGSRGLRLTIEALA